MDTTNVEHLYHSRHWDAKTQRSHYASGYVQSYVHGILDMLASDHYHVLTFGFVQEDGRILTTDELRELYGSEWHLYCTSENGQYFYHEDADRPLF